MKKELSKKEAFLAVCDIKENRFVKKLGGNKDGYT